jgi:hypothetical protein
MGVQGHYVVWGIYEEKKKIKKTVHEIPLMVIT